ATSRPFSRARAITRCPRSTSRSSRRRPWKRKRPRRPARVTFPLVLHVGSIAVPAHPVFESLGYLLGFRTYLALRARRSDGIPDETRLWVIAAAAIGAVIGSKVLGWLDHPDLTWEHRGDLLWLLGGKTIVGGLLGGLIGVEWAKRLLHETRSTGDLF